MGRSHARDAANRNFDAACEWIDQHEDPPGPVLTRHPGEVFLRTGRQALEVSTSERPGYRVAYLLIDNERYAQAPPSPLVRFISEHPERVRKVWSQEAGASRVAIYEVLRDH
jgi:hypothetical protein